MKKHLIILLVIVIISSSFTYDKIIIEGTITDERGEAVPGVTIVQKGTSHGVVSDLNGKYSISVEPGSTLVYSFIGYNTEEISVNNRTTVIDIELIPDIMSEDEIVIVC